MTEYKTVLETVLDDLVSDALETNVEFIDGLVLSGWRDMCIGALSALSKRPQVHRVDKWSIGDILWHVSAHASTMSRNALPSEEIRSHCDTTGEFLSLAYAKLEKLELEKREKERLETVTVAQQNGVTPIGVAVEGTQKGQLVFVQVGATSSPTVAPPCPPNCKFAKWRTDGKPSTEPGYSARCDVCKLDVKRPGFESDGTWSPGEPLIIASHFIDQNMNRRASEPKQPRCCGGCNCQKEPLYK